MGAYPVTEEDSALVKRYVILPFILSVFERDKEKIQTAVKTPDPYIRAIDSAMDRVTRDLKEIRAAFRQHGIKVYEEARLEDRIQVKYLCRGYHGEFALLWSILSAEVKMKMEKYLGLDTSVFADPTVPEHLRRDI